MIDRLEAEADRSGEQLGLLPLTVALDRQRQAAAETDPPEGPVGPVRLASERMASVQAIVQGLLESVLLSREETR